jgi:hypothetical protein
MKLFLIWQNELTCYDAYDYAVVAAINEDEAKNIHPSGRNDRDRWGSNWGDWASDPSDVFVKEIGIATEGTEVGVICASYNVG